MITDYYQQTVDRQLWRIFVIRTKLEYKAGLIKEESVSELLIYSTIILKQVHRQPEYHTQATIESSKLAALTSY